MNGPSKQKQSWRGADLRDAAHEGARQIFTPLADVAETQNEYLIYADMPGVSDQQVDITLENDVLTLRGRVEPVEFKGQRLLYSEYEDGDYRRVFTVSDDIDRNGVQASLRNGVLEIRLPKSEVAKPKKIQVKPA